MLARTSLPGDRDGAATLIGSGPEPVWIASPRGYAIPVRRYGTAGRRRPVIMLHGLESHSGWFVQSARAIAARGLPAHAFDRCGSGLSLTDPALGARFDALFAEIDAVGEAALEGTPHRAVHLVGHCFGALLALLYAAQRRPSRVASLVLATPALYTRDDLPPRRKARILWRALRAPAAREPVPLGPEDFSELEPFVDFIRRDPLALHSVPARLLFEIWRARFRLPRAAAALRVPLFAALAREDVVCDNPRNLALLARVKTSVEIIEYAGARHVLEFSGQRAAFLTELGAWLESQEKS